MFSIKGLSSQRRQARFSSLEFRQSGNLWLAYLSAPTPFDYVLLANFHAQGTDAARMLMIGNDHLQGSSNGDHLEGYAGDDTLMAASAQIRWMADRATTPISWIIRTIAFSKRSALVMTSSLRVHFAMAADAEIEELEGGR